MKPESNLMMCVKANKLVRVQTYTLYMAKHSLQTKADLERKTLTSRCWLWRTECGCWSPRRSCWGSLPPWWSLCPPDTPGRTERWRELTGSKEGEVEVERETKERLQHWFQLCVCSPLAQPWWSGWWSRADIPCWSDSDNLLQIRQTCSRRTVYPRRTPSWRREIHHSQWTLHTFFTFPSLSFSADNCKA